MRNWIKVKVSFLIFIALLANWCGKIDASKDVAPLSGFIFKEGKFYLISFESKVVLSPKFDLVVAADTFGRTFLGYDLSEGVKLTFVQDSSQSFSIMESIPIPREELVNNFSQCEKLKSLLPLHFGNRKLDTTFLMMNGVHLFVRDSVWGYEHSNAVIWADTVIGKYFYLLSKRNMDYEIYGDADSITRKELVEQYLNFEKTFDAAIPWIIHSFGKHDSAKKQLPASCFIYR